MVALPARSDFTSLPVSATPASKVSPISVIETRLSIVGDNLLRALVLFSHLAQSDRGREGRPRGALS